MSLGCDNSGSAGTWTLVAANPPPVAVNESVATKKNTALSIDLSAGASGNPTSAALVGTPANGSVSGFPATTVTFTPTKGFTGAANFQFTLSNAGGTSNTATASIIVGPPPSPQIFANGVNITGSTTTNPALAVVGQPIQLTATPSPQPGQTQTWGGIPQRAIVGGFVVSPTCPSSGTPPPCTGTVTTLTTSDFMSPSPPVFYWVVPGSYGIKYAYTLSDGTSASATATFKVEGPTQPSVTVVESTLSIPTNSDNIVFGGIVFEASAIQPADYTGMFQWTQLIDNYTYTETTSQNATLTCTLGTGLDNKYPAYEGISASDAPTLGPIPPIALTTHWKLDADMYLMWTATNVANPIPVPLGYVSWGFEGTAKRNKGSLSLTSSTLLPRSPSFQNKNQYPQWTTLVFNGSPQCN